MRFKQLLTTTALAGGIALSYGTAWAASANDILGKWITPSNKSKIEIYKKGDKFFGKIVWLKEPTLNGKDKTDSKNPNPKLKSRKLMGLNLLNNFTYKGGEWVGGTIYNPIDGKEYSCKIKTKGAKELEVRGYVLNPMLGKTQIWTKSK